MAAHATMDAATEEQCFLYGPCLAVMSRTISGASSIERSEAADWQVRSVQMS
jgi:hypothetical protein